MDEKELADLLTQIPDDDPKMLELLAKTLIGYVDRLESRPSWADSFCDTLETLVASPEAIELWPLFLTRTYQMLARTREWTADELDTTDARGRLLPHVRVLIFARLSFPDPDWNLVDEIDVDAYDPVSRTLHRLRPGADRNGLGARHLWALDRARTTPLGFGQLLLEEARMGQENPISRLLELLVLGTMIDDPILDHEHQPELVAALRGRWHLYTASAYLGSDQPTMLAEHMLRYQALAREAPHDVELAASGFELLAAEKARLGQFWDARNQVERALSHLGDAGPEGRREELEELAASLDERAAEAGTGEDRWPGVATGGREPVPS